MFLGTSPSVKCPGISWTMSMDFVRLKYWNSGPWTTPRESMDSFRGAHGQCPGSPLTLSLGTCPGSPWTSAFDFFPGHPGLYIEYNFTIQFTMHVIFFHDIHVLLIWPTKLSDTLSLGPLLSISHQNVIHCFTSDPVLWVCKNPWTFYRWIGLGN